MLGSVENLSAKVLVFILFYIRASQNPSRAQPAAQYMPRPGVPIWLAVIDF